MKLAVSSWFFPSGSEIWLPAEAAGDPFSKHTAMNPYRSCQLWK